MILSLGDTTTQLDPGFIDYYFPTKLHATQTLSSGLSAWQERGEAITGNQLVGQTGNSFRLGNEPVPEASLPSLVAHNAASRCILDRLPNIRLRCSGNDCAAKELASMPIDVRHRAFVGGSALDYIGRYPENVRRGRPDVRS